MAKRVHGTYSFCICLSNTEKKIEISMPKCPEVRCTNLFSVFFTKNNDLRMCEIEGKARKHKVRLFFLKKGDLCAVCVKQN